MSVAPIATTAPMPALGDLLARDTIPDDPTLARPWIGEGDVAVFLTRASWAIRAVVDGHADVNGVPLRLWVPDYFCSSALVPARQSAARLVFYPINERFEPDWPACEAIAESEPPRLFLQVHYFGRPSDFSRTRSFCDKHRASIIEDATHVLAPVGGVGWAGDYTIWSLYKHLPAPDGGLLTARGGAPSLSAVLGAARRLAAKGTALPGSWPLRRMGQILMPGIAAHFAHPAAPFETDPAPPPVSAAPGISQMARRLIGRWAPHLSEIGEKRRANDAAARLALQHCPGLRPAFPAPPPGIVPFRAVFQAESTERARYWHEQLVSRGNAVETWPDMAPELYSTPQRHAGAIALRATCFALPIHADRTPEDMLAAYGNCR